MTKDEHRVSTGVAGIDAVLGGGLPSRRMYLIHGRPGVGKTTLALQFLLAGREAGETGLYVGLSETDEEIRSIAESHGWSLDGIATCDLQVHESAADDAEYTFFHPSEIELTDTTRMIRETLDRVRPQRVVFDSLSELRLMARDSLRYRRQILSLKDYVAGRGATVLLLDTQLAQDTREFQLETLAHGVIAMEQNAPGYGGTRRRFRVDKLRGSGFLEGYHDLTIEMGGIRAFPRLSPGRGPGPQLVDEPLQPFVSGIPELDRLCGGGIDRGTTTMIVGPAGVGKSSLSTRLCLSALEQGEGVAVFHFDEGVRKWIHRSRWLLPDFDPERYRDTLQLQQVNPAEMSPGAFAETIRRAVEERNVSMVVIDSINGYRSSMVEESYLTLHLHELFRFLNERDVVTLVVAAQHGFVGRELDDAFRLSYLADNVIVMRYFEAFGQLRKAIALAKKRTGDHEKLIRELHLGEAGLQVGENLGDFQGILGGELTYSGRQERLIGEHDGVD